MTQHRRRARRRAPYHGRRQVLRRFAFDWLTYALFVLLVAGAIPAVAETSATVSAAASRGPVTNLPIPRFVSLKASEGNARRGPSLSHRIDWVFVRRDMPLEITGEYGHWRRVRDREGAGGWIHYSLLSGVRTVILSEPLTPLRMRPEDDAPILAQAEAGVVARLGPCEPAWCRVSISNHKGWAPKAALWGVRADEIRD